MVFGFGGIDIADASFGLARSGGAGKSVSRAPDDKTGVVGGVVGAVLWARVCGAGRAVPAAPGEARPEAGPLGGLSSFLRPNKAITLFPLHPGRGGRTAAAGTCARLAWATRCGAPTQPAAACQLRELPG
jgi:hypothetical protein